MESEQRNDQPEKQCDFGSHGFDSYIGAADAPVGKQATRSPLNWKMRILPFEHTALQVPYVLEAEASQNRGGSGAAHSHSAYRDDFAAFCIRQLGAPLGQF